MFQRRRSHGQSDGNRHEDYGLLPPALRDLCAAHPPETDAADEEGGAGREGCAWMLEVQRLLREHERGEEHAGCRHQDSEGLDRMPVDHVGSNNVETEPVGGTGSAEASLWIASVYAGGPTRGDFRGAPASLSAK